MATAPKEAPSLAATTPAGPPGLTLTETRVGARAAIITQRGDGGHPFIFTTVAGGRAGPEQHGRMSTPGPAPEPALRQREPEEHA